MVKVVATDDHGEFPRVWHAWGEVDLSPWVIGCVLTQNGKKKTRVELPEGQPRCGAYCTVGSYTYYEHFVSNPPSQCLGWLECKVPVVPEN